MMIGWIKRVLLLLPVLLFLLPVQNVLAAETLVDNADGTVTDSERGLMWQQQDDDVERVWNDAVSYCDDLDLAGNTDWHLPKIHMLESLIDSSNSPTIAPVFKVKPSYYWSSSVSLNSSKSAKYVNFFYGNTYAYSKDNTYYVICVRDVATEVIPPLKASIDIEASDMEAPFATSFSSNTTGGKGPFFYEWDFSDGDTSSLANPKHVFEVAGTYEVMLTVSDNEGAITVATEQLVLPFVEKSPEEIDDLVRENSLSPGGEVDLLSKENIKDKDLVAPVAEKAEEIDEMVSADSGGEVITPVVTDHNLGMVNVEDEVADGSILKAKSTVVDSEVNRDSETSVEKKTLAAESSNEMLGDDNIKQKDVGAAEQTAYADEKETPGDAVDSLEKAKLNEKKIEASVPQTKEPAKIMQIFASADQKPLTIESSGNGLLAYSLANALGGDADWNKDGKVSAKELASYIPIAVDNLSGGKQKPVIQPTGEDFFICSATGVTYVLSVGVNMHEGEFKAQISAAKDADAVRTGIEGKCLAQKTMILSGVRATRTEIVQAMGMIGDMLTENDNLIFYYGGASEVNNDKLNMLTYDSIKGMTDFTGLFYEDMVNFFKGTKVRDMLFVIESGPLPKH